MLLKVGLSRQLVDVINHKNLNLTEGFPERFVGGRRKRRAIDKKISAIQVDNGTVSLGLASIANGMQKMSFTESGRTFNKERIKCGLTILTDFFGCGKSKTVKRGDYIGFKSLRPVKVRGEWHIPYGWSLLFGRHPCTIRHSKDDSDTTVYVSAA
jgi:hypothetical protein